MHRVRVARARHGRSWHGSSALGGRRCREHFRQGPLHAKGRKASLPGDRVLEEIAKLQHPRALKVGGELRPALPWTGPVEPCRNLNALARQIIDQFWKTFLERTPLPRGVPDEVSDSERGELLPCIPSGQSADRPARFILPDASSNFESLGSESSTVCDMPADIATREGTSSSAWHLLPAGSDTRKSESLLEVAPSVRLRSSPMRENR